MTKPLCLVLTDSHEDKDNIDNIENLWDKAIDICLTHNIKIIYHAGDIFTERAAQPLEVLISMYRIINKLIKHGIILNAIPGNHDKTNLESEWSYLSIFDCDNFRVWSDYYVEDLTKDIRVFMLPYFPELGSYPNRLEALKTKVGSGINILITHIGVNGGLAHENATTNKEVSAKIFDAFDKVMIGHYHNRHKVKGHEIYYIGSTHQQNFGEDENKGFTLLYEDGSHQHIPSDMTIFKTIEVDADSIDKEFLEGIKREKNSTNSKIRLVVHGDESAIKSIDKKSIAACGVDKLKLNSESLSIRQEEKEVTFVNFDKAELIKEYKVFSTDQEIDSKVGLEYLTAL